MVTDGFAVSLVLERHVQPKRQIDRENHFELLVSTGERDNEKVINFTVYVGNGSFYMYIYNLKSTAIKNSEYIGVFPRILYLFK